MAITASYDTLLQQAPMTADTYFKAAIRTIDNQFGEGYAKAHPELIGAYMKVCASDMNQSSLVVAIQEASDAIASGLQYDSNR